MKPQTAEQINAQQCGMVVTVAGLPIHTTPTPRTVEDRVIEKIQTRRAAGFKKYGVTMEREDLSELDWLIHAQEEALDLAIYLQKLIDKKSGK